MVEVYFYIPVEKLDSAVECGLKLSVWSDREVEIEGSMKRCMSALLNPKDDVAKYRAENLKCIKLELSPDYCYVADRHLYRIGLKFPQVMEMYKKSIMPIEKYIFGNYRLPECLITSTVIEGQITVLDKRLDSPILFNSSEELYTNNIIEAYKEENEDFNDTILYYFYSKLAECGKVDRIEDRDKGMAVFMDRLRGRAFTIKIPDIG